MRIYEQKLIGAIAAGVVKPSDVNLDSSDFSESDLGVCLNVAKQIEAEGKTIDADLLYARTSLTDAVFYAASDFRLWGRTAQSASVAFEAAERVRAASLKSFLLEKTATLALQDNLSGAELLDRIKQSAQEADKFYAAKGNSFVFLKDIAAKSAVVYRDLYAGKSYSVPTYFSQYDEALLDGYSRGDEHLIVGFTGHGKSALALNCALNQAKRKTVVGVVSREMSDIENVMRLQSADAQIPRWKIRKDMSDLTYRALLTHLDDFSQLPIAFDTTTEDVEDLRPQVKRMVDDEGLGILYVDYLQLMTSGSNSDMRSTEVQSISRTLKQIAMENNIPVVSLVQFNNGALNASIYDVMNFIRESGSIKQDASTITYIQVEQTEERKQIKDAKITILKNRNGETFTPILLKYQGEIFQFTEAVNA